MKILQVSTSDDRGGAAMVASALHAEFRRRGHTSWMAVGTRRSNDPDIFEIPNESAAAPWTRAFNRAAALTGKALANVPGGSRLEQMIRDVGSPETAASRRSGSEIFEYPGTWWIPSLPPEPPDVLHLHNLHGGYFDLRALPWLTARLPTAITLHDAWMLAGHCAHSFGCGRWETGCGACPDLSIPPAIVRDDTAANWQRKRAIYSKTRLYVISPSRWLLGKVQRSILSAAAVDSVVIPNGVDVSIFRPGDKRQSRIRVGLPADARTILFAANGVRNNPWKDFKSLQRAVEILGARTDASKIVFLALGEEGKTETIGGATIRFEPYHDNREIVADYYRAADIYMHAARADTFPNTILEALACGTPVVATDVGGIPEQIRSLDHSASAAGDHFDRDSATGVVVNPGDAEGLASAAGILLDDDLLLARLGDNAAADVIERFTLEAQVDAYLALYSRMLTEAESKEAVLSRAGYEELQ